MVVRLRPLGGRSAADRRPDDQQRQHRGDGEHHERFDEQDQRLGDAVGIGQEAGGDGETDHADQQEHRGSCDQHDAQPASIDRRCLCRVAPSCTIIAIAARSAPPWKAPPSSLASTQAIWTATTMPTGGNSCAKKVRGP